MSFSKIIKNCLKVGKNGLKVGFNLVWWVLYSGLLFEGGHDINCREINWVVGYEVSSICTVGHNTKCHVVFRGSIFVQFRRIICHDTKCLELFQKVKD